MNPQTTEERAEETRDFVELGEVSTDTKGGFGAWQVDGGGGYFF